MKLNILHVLILSLDMKLGKPVIPKLDTTAKV